MTKYTYEFEKDAERKFKEVLARLDPDEHTVIQGIAPIDPAEPRYSALRTEMDMDPEACLTIRMAMGGNVKIRRERTEEELAEDAAREEKNTIRINVKVPPEMLPPGK